jgi:hypothetical protein
MTKPITPTHVDLNCPFCGRMITADSGPRVNISKMMKLPAGHLAYAHKSCVEERLEKDAL